jgi:hypothetical protein
MVEKAQDGSPLAVADLRSLEPKYKLRVGVFAPFHVLSTRAVTPIMPCRSHNNAHSKSKL